MLNFGRVLIGGLVAGLILFVVGFIFWATPLGELAYKTADDQQSAAVQLALSQNLTQTGTGAYVIPNPTTQQGGVQYSQGPIATVYFNTQGYSPDDMSTILPGLILALVAGVLIAVGLAFGARNANFAERARLVLFFSLGATIWTILTQPVMNHFGWGYWIYSFIAETTALVLAGLVVARWFLPHPHVAAPAAAAEPPQAREPEAHPS
jgi:hypothetical protein